MRRTLMMLSAALAVPMLCSNPATAAKSRADDGTLAARSESERGSEGTGEKSGTNRARGQDGGGRTGAGGRDTRDPDTSSGRSGRMENQRGSTMEDMPEETDGGSGRMGRERSGTYPDEGGELPPAPDEDSMEGGGAGGMSR